MHTEQNIHGHLRWLCLQPCHEHHIAFASSCFACDHHKRCKAPCTGSSVVLAFCYTMVRTLTGARHNSSLQIKGMSNSKWSREVISWQSLSGVSWSFFLVHSLGDHTFLWECEGRGRGEKNLNNNFKEHKLFSWVFVKCEKFWKSNFTPFLKTRPSKMKYCKCTNLILVSHSIANNYLIPWILVKGFSLHRKRLAVPVAFASG